MSVPPTTLIVIGTEETPSGAPRSTKSGVSSADGAAASHSNHSSRPASGEEKVAELVLRVHNIVLG